MLICLYIRFYKYISVEEKKEQALHKIISTKGKVESEISDLKEKVKLARETITIFKDEIAKLSIHPMTNTTPA